MKLSINVDQTVRKDAAHRYGLPTGWFDTIPSDPSDLDSIRDKFKSRGVAVNFRGEFNLNTLQDLKKLIVDNVNSLMKSPEYVTYISPDWMGLIERNKQHVKPLADKLIHVASQNGYQSPRDIAAVVSSFVQSISYRVPDDHYVHPELGQIKSLGLTMPLDTLCEDSGDCDSKALLFAAIMSNVPGQSVIFLIGKKDFQHIFVGVNVEIQAGEKSVSHSGKHYLLIELTGNFPMGKIPKGTMKSYYGSNPSKFLVVDNSSE